MDILFIEDDLIETMKFQRIISKMRLTHKIREAKNGEEALLELKNSPRLPDLILLDLNMPRMSGLEFLKILKEDEVLRYLPTVVLTTSENQADLLEAYRIGIAGYVIKPLKPEDYEDKLRKVLEYWDINELVKP
ncbi:MAG: response regulator [Eudoraea sp.]|nr:response regulator [Eudoraea sp.]